VCLYLYVYIILIFIYFTYTYNLVGEGGGSCFREEYTGTGAGGVDYMCVCHHASTIESGTKQTVYEHPHTNFYIHQSPALYTNP